MLHSKSAISELFHKPLHVHMWKAEGGGWSPNMIELYVRNTMKAIQIPWPQCCHCTNMPSFSHTIESCLLIVCLRAITSSWNRAIMTLYVACSKACHCASNGWGPVVDRMGFFLKARSIVKILRMSFATKTDSRILYFKMTCLHFIVKFKFTFAVWFLNLARYVFFSVYQFRTISYYTIYDINYFFRGKTTFVNNELK